MKITPFTIKDVRRSMYVLHDSTWWQIKSIRRHDEAGESTLTLVGSTGRTAITRSNLGSIDCWTSDGDPRPVNVMPTLTPTTASHKETAVMNYDPSRTSDLDRRSIESVEDATAIIDRWAEATAPAYTEQFDRVAAAYASRLTGLPERVRFTKATEAVMSIFRQVQQATQDASGNWSDHERFIGRVALDLDPAEIGRPQTFGRGFGADGISDLVTPAEYQRLVEEYGDHASIPKGQGGVAEVVFAYVNPNSAQGQAGVEAMAFRWTPTSSNLRRPKAGRPHTSWSPSHYYGFVDGIKFYTDATQAEADMADLQQAVRTFTFVETAMRDDAQVVVSVSQPGPDVTPDPF